MASDRTRELAKEILRLDRDKENRIVALLDDFERETRLDEAKWWEHLVTNEGHDDVCDPDCVYCKRIADLAAQPTPEKERGKP